MSQYFLPKLFSWLTISNDSEPKKSVKFVNLRHIVLLGVGMVVSGQYTAWSLSLTVGFWQYFGALLFIGSGYLCLALCLAEMSAALPFSGGTYGLARVTLGAFPAFLIGSCETMEYVLYVAFSTGACSQMITILGETDDKYQPYYFAMIYTSILVIHLSCEKAFWNCSSLIGLFVLTMSLLYCIGATPNNGDFDHNVTQVHVETTSLDWFRVIPSASFFFVGIETLPLSCGEVVKASKTIPKAILITIAIALGLSIAILFSCASIAPGMAGLSHVYTPLNDGFGLLFNIASPLTLPFTLIAVYAKVLGFSFAFVRQMTALDKSNLLINFLPRARKYFPINVRVLLLGCGLGLAFLNVKFKFRTQNGQQYDRYFESATLICAFLSYIGIFCSYIAYKQQFHTLSKTYKNPLNVYGAMYGIAVFLSAFISSVAFQKDHGIAFIIFAIFMSIELLYYFTWGCKNQIYSSEEQAVLFIAYIMKANNMKRNNLKNKNKHNSNRLKHKKQPALKQSENHNTTQSVTPNDNIDNSNNIELAITSNNINTEHGVSSIQTDEQTLNSNINNIHDVNNMLNNNTNKTKPSNNNNTQFDNPNTKRTTRQFIASLLHPITPHVASAKILPTIHSSNIISPSNDNTVEEMHRQSSDIFSTHSESSSQNSGQSDEVYKFLEELPEHYMPKDLDFDESILDTYHEALEQLNNYKEKKSVSADNKQKSSQSHNSSGVNVKEEELISGGGVERSVVQPATTAAPLMDTPPLVDLK